MEQAIKIPKALRATYLEAFMRDPSTDHMQVDDPSKLKPGIDRMSYLEKTIFWEKSHSLYYFFMDQTLDDFWGGSPNEGITYVHTPAIAAYGKAKNTLRMLEFYTAYTSPQSDLSHRWDMEGADGSEISEVAKWYKVVQYADANTEEEPLLRAELTKIFAKLAKEGSVPNMSFFNIGKSSGQTKHHMTALVPRKGDCIYTINSGGGMEYQGNQVICKWLPKDTGNVKGLVDTAVEVWLCSIPYQLTVRDVYTRLKRNFIIDEKASFYALFDGKVVVAPQLAGSCSFYGTWWAILFCMDKTDTHPGIDHSLYKQYFTEYLLSTVVTTLGTSHHLLPMTSVMYVLTILCTHPEVKDLVFALPGFSERRKFADWVGALVAKKITLSGISPGKALSVYTEENFGGLAFLSFLPSIPVEDKIPKAELLRNITEGESIFQYLAYVAQNFKLAPESAVIMLATENAEFLVNSIQLLKWLDGIAWDIYSTEKYKVELTQLDKPEGDERRGEVLQNLRQTIRTVHTGMFFRLGRTSPAIGTDSKEISTLCQAISPASFTLVFCFLLSAFGGNLRISLRQKCDRKIREGEIPDRSHLIGFFSSEFTEVELPEMFTEPSMMFEYTFDRLRVPWSVYAETFMASSYCFPWINKSNRTSLIGYEASRLTKTEIILMSAYNDALKIAFPVQYGSLFSFLRPNKLKNAIERHEQVYRIDDTPLLDDQNQCNESNMCRLLLFTPEVLKGKFFQESRPRPVAHNLLYALQSLDEPVHLLQYTEGLATRDSQVFTSKLSNLDPIAYQSMVQLGVLTTDPGELARTYYENSSTFIDPTFPGLDRINVYAQIIAHEVKKQLITKAKIRVPRETRDHIIDVVFTECMEDLWNDTEGFSQHFEQFCMNNFSREVANDRVNLNLIVDVINQIRDRHIGKLADKMAILGRKMDIIHLGVNGVGIGLRRLLFGIDAVRADIWKMIAERRGDFAPTNLGDKLAMEVMEIQANFKYSGIDIPPHIFENVVRFYSVPNENYIALEYSGKIYEGLGKNSESQLLNGVYIRDEKGGHTYVTRILKVECYLLPDTIRRTIKHVYRESSTIDFTQQPAQEWLQSYYDLANPKYVNSAPSVMFREKMREIIGEWAGYAGDIFSTLAGCSRSHRMLSCPIFGIERIPVLLLEWFSVFRYFVPMFMPKSERIIRRFCTFTEINRRTARSLHFYAVRKSDPELLVFFNPNSPTQPAVLLRVTPVRCLISVQDSGTTRKFRALTETELDENPLFTSWSGFNHRNVLMVDEGDERARRKYILGYIASDRFATQLGEEDTIFASVDKSYDIYNVKPRTAESKSRSLTDERFESFDQSTDKAFGFRIWKIHDSGLWIEKPLGEDSLEHYGSDQAIMSILAGSASGFSGPEIYTSSVTTGNPDLESTVYGELSRHAQEDLTTPRMRQWFEVAKNFTRAFAGLLNPTPLVSVGGESVEAMAYRGCCNVSTGKLKELHALLRTMVDTVERQTAGSPIVQIDIFLRVHSVIQGYPVTSEPVPIYKSVCVAELLLRDPVVRDWAYERMMLKILDETCTRMGSLIDKGGITCNQVLYAMELLDPSVVCFDEISRTGETVVTEVYSGYLVKKAQRELINAIKSQRVCQGTIYQMLMGGGKTSFITPLLVAESILANKSAIVVMPSSLIRTSADIIKGLCQMFWFVRTYTTAYDTTGALFPDVLKQRTMVTFPTPCVNILSDKAAQYSRLVNLLPPGQREVGASWGEAWGGRSTVIFDEIDSLLDPLKCEMNIPTRPPTRPPYAVDLIRTTQYFAIDRYHMADEIRMRVRSIPYQATLTKQQRQKLTDMFDFAATKMRYNEDYGFGDVVKDQPENRVMAIPFIRVNQPANGSRFTDVELYVVLTAFSYVQFIVRGRFEKMRKEDLLHALMYLSETYRKLYGTVSLPSSRADLIRMIHLILPYHSRASRGKIGQILADVIENQSDENVEKSLGSAREAFADATPVELMQVAMHQFGFVCFEYLRTNTEQTNIGMLEFLHPTISPQAVSFSGTVNIRQHSEQDSEALGLPKLVYHVVPNIPDEQTINAIISGAVCMRGLGSGYDTPPALRLPPPGEGVSADQKFIEVAVDAQYGYNALVDVSGIMKFKTPLEYAVDVQRALQKGRVEGKAYAVYFVDGGTRKILAPNGKEVSLYTGKMPAGRAYFFVYDQRSSVGIDFKQPEIMKGLVSIDERTTRTAAAQGVFRLRKLARGHTIDFYTNSTDQDVLRDFSRGDLRVKRLAETETASAKGREYMEFKQHIKASNRCLMADARSFKETVMDERDLSRKFTGQKAEIEYYAWKKREDSTRIADYVIQIFRDSGNPCKIGGKLEGTIGKRVWEYVQSLERTKDSSIAAVHQAVAVQRQVEVQVQVAVETDVAVNVQVALQMKASKPFVNPRFLDYATDVIFNPARSAPGDSPADETVTAVVNILLSLVRMYEPYSTTNVDIHFSSQAELVLGREIYGKTPVSCGCYYLMRRIDMSSGRARITDVIITPEEYLNFRYWTGYLMMLDGRRKLLGDLFNDKLEAVFQAGVGALADTNFVFYNKSSPDKPAWSAYVQTSEDTIVVPFIVKLLCLRMSYQINDSSRKEEMEVFLRQLRSPTEAKLVKLLNSKTKLFETLTNVDSYNATSERVDREVLL